MYNLFAVANHEGSLNQGHYYAYSWNHASQNWYYQSDDEIKLVQNLSKIVSKDAYLLFYTKTSVENFLRQTLRLPQYWPYVVQEQQRRPRGKKKKRPPVAAEGEYTELSKAEQSFVELTKNVPDATPQDEVDSH